MSQKKTLDVPSAAKKPSSKDNSSSSAGSGAIKSLKAGVNVKSTNSRKNLSNMSTRGGGSRKFRTSRSGSNKKSTKKNEARVKDKSGNDVTPKPLTITTKASKNKMGSDLDISVDNFALKSGGAQSTTSDAQSETIGEDGANIKNPNTGSFAAGGKPKPEVVEVVEEVAAVAVVKKLTEAELKEAITVKITETETFTLLHIPGVKVWGDNEALHDQCQANNDAYQVHLDRVKAEKDMYIQRHAQTFNNSLRNKEVQASPPATLSTEVQITTWDIYDSMLEKSEEEQKKLRKG